MLHPCHDLLTMNTILCCCVHIVDGFGNIVTVGCQGGSITILPEQWEAIEHLT